MRPLMTFYRGEEITYSTPAQLTPDAIHEVARSNQGFWTADEKMKDAVHKMADELAYLKAENAYLKEKLQTSMHPITQLQDMLGGVPSGQPEDDEPGSSGSDEDVEDVSSPPQRPPPRPPRHWRDLHPHDEPAPPVLPHRTWCVSVIILK
jgi:hypothetical protein